MRDEAAGGAEIAVTEEMKSAGIDAFAETLNAHDDAHAVSQIYRAMRALEPAAEPSKPVLVYEIGTDKHRPITQADVQVFEAVMVAYGEIRRQVDTIHAQLQQKIGLIRSKHGLPHEGAGR